MGIFVYYEKSTSLGPAIIIIDCTESLTQAGLYNCEPPVPYNSNRAAVGQKESVYMDIQLNRQQIG
jgi:hypothetical protein